MVAPTPTENKEKKMEDMTGAPANGSSHISVREGAESEMDPKTSKFVPGQASARPSRKAAVKAQNAIAAASVIENEKSDSLTCPANIADFMDAEVSKPNGSMVSGVIEDIMNSKSLFGMNVNSGTPPPEETGSLSRKRKDGDAEEQTASKRARLMNKGADVTPKEYNNGAADSDANVDSLSISLTGLARRSSSVSHIKATTPADLQADVCSLINAATTCSSLDGVVKLIDERLPAYRGNNIHAKLLRRTHADLNVGVFTNRKVAVAEMAEKLWILGGGKGPESARQMAASVHVDHLPENLREFGSTEQPTPVIISVEAPKPRSVDMAQRVNLGSRPRTGSSSAKRHRHIPAVDLSKYSQDFLDLATSIRQSLKLNSEDIPQLKTMMNTGILAGQKVRYQSRSGEVRTHGQINDAGTQIKCGCAHCKWKKNITPTEFESHAGSADKRPADGIYFEKFGHSFRELLQVIATQAGSAVAKGKLKTEKTYKSHPLSRLASLSGKDRTCIICDAGGDLVGCAVCKGAYHGACLDKTGSCTGALFCPFCVQSSRPMSTKIGSSSKGKKCSRSSTEARHSGYSPAGLRNSPNRVHMVAPSLQRRPRSAVRNFNRNRRLFSAMEGGLKNGERVHYVVRGERKLSGTVVINPHGQSGIMADKDGNKILSCSQFEALAGFAQRRQPYENIFTDDGRNLKSISNALPLPEDESGEIGLDDIADSCRDLLSDLDSLIGGCQVCREPDFLKNDFGARTMILCDQCEREFHVGCLEKAGLPRLQSLPEGDWFCNHTCEVIHGKLQKKVMEGQMAVDLTALGLYRSSNCTREIRKEEDAAVQGDVSESNTAVDIEPTKSVEEFKTSDLTNAEPQLASEVGMVEDIGDANDCGAIGVEGGKDNAKDLETKGSPFSDPNATTTPNEDVGDAVAAQFETSDMMVVETPAVETDEGSDSRCVKTSKAAVVPDVFETGKTLNHDAKTALGKRTTSGSDIGSTTNSTLYTWQILNGRRGASNVAWSLKCASDILTESFDPIMDVSNNVDLLPLMLSAKQHGDWDYRGMYTLLLRFKGRAVVAAVVRVCGPTLAELPLIATRDTSRRQGHAKVLVRLFEELLKELGVHQLVLPAAHETIETWKKGFGFANMAEDLVHAVKHQLRVLVFPGTTVLWKNIDGVAPPTGHYVLRVLPEPDSLIVRRVLANIVDKLEEEAGDAQPDYWKREALRRRMEKMQEIKSARINEQAKAIVTPPPSFTTTGGGSLTTARTSLPPPSGVRRSSRGTRSTVRFSEDTSDSDQGKSLKTSMYAAEGSSERPRSSVFNGIGSRTNWASYPPGTGKEAVILTKAQVSSGSMSLPMTRCYNIFQRSDNCQVKIIDSSRAEVSWEVQHRLYSSQPTQAFLQKMKPLIADTGMEPGDVIIFEHLEPGVAEIVYFKEDSKEAEGFREFLKSGGNRQGTATARSSGIGEETDDEEMKPTIRVDGLKQEEPAADGQEEQSPADADIVMPAAAVPS